MLLLDDDFYFLYGYRITNTPQYDCLVDSDISIYTVGSEMAQ